MILDLTLTAPLLLRSLLSCSLLTSSLLILYRRVICGRTRLLGSLRGNRSRRILLIPGMRRTIGGLLSRIRWMLLLLLLRRKGRLLLMLRGKLLLLLRLRGKLLLLLRLRVLAVG